jgi:TonB family protein
LKYPESAAEKGLQGRVIVKFVVNQEGYVESANIMRGINPDLDEEVVRIIKSSPIWKPAEQGGQHVSQQFVIPVNFKITK